MKSIRKFVSGRDLSVAKQPLKLVGRAMQDMINKLAKEKVHLKDCVVEIRIQELSSDSGDNSEGE